MDPFATPEDLATQLQRPVDRAAAEMRLAEASSAIRQMCEWHIWPVLTETLTVDGSGSELLALPTLRLVTVTAIAENSQVLDVSTLEISGTGMIRRGNCRSWTSRFSGITTTIEHGHDEVPDWLRGVVCSVVGRVLDVPAGVTYEQSGSEAVSYVAIDKSSFTGHELGLVHRLALEPSP